MRIHNYLEESMASKVKIKVLRELHKHPTKFYTIRELSTEIGDITHTGIRKVMDDLWKTNLIKIEHHGQSNLIWLNQKSILFNTFKTIFEQESAAFSELKGELAAGIPGKVTSAAIFGSFAKGTEKLDSDIDLLIITEDKDAVVPFIENKSKKIIERYGNTLSPLFFSKNEFKARKNSELVKSILSRHVKLSGEKLSSLIQK